MKMEYYEWNNEHIVLNTCIDVDEAVKIIKKDIE